jgi:hypothetical protein
MEIKIERSIDVIAVLGFLLALITATVQLTAYLKGANLILLPTDQVLIQCDHDSGDYVRFVARMSYFNKGSPGYSSVIQRETLRYRLKGKIHEQVWQMFATFDYGKSGLEIVDKESAHPDVVDGGSGLSHETYFAPHPDVVGSFVKWDEFLGDLKKSSELELELVSQIYGDEPRVMRCKIKITPGLLLALETRLMSAPPCYPEPTDGASAVDFPIVPYAFSSGPRSRFPVTGSIILPRSVENSLRLSRFPQVIGNAHRMNGSGA